MKITPGQARSLAEQLLDGEDSILEGLSASEGDAAPLPETIGGYRILRLIASGGMGRVYEAEQIHPHRIVAIKVLRQGLSSHTAQRRFEYEAELLGALQHPGIGTVFEAGMHDDGGGGVPFFVMEFIPGARPITKYADEKGLDIRQRLELLAQACDAVQYGHQKGIIHRDLKPANILVGEEKSGKLTVESRNEEGESPATAGSKQHEPLAMSHEGTSLPDFKPSGLLLKSQDSRPKSQDHSFTPILKIIDFGIARATDSDIAITTMHTEVGQLIGTLQYMSPEQCEGDPRKLDTRSDVYSLGVVLYELVCGRLPYDVSDTSIPHATRMIQENEPQRPSTISRKLKGDLETIALKALEKDREKRYQSAAELGADVRRYLRGEPIEAKSPTAWVMCTRWIGQHPVTTTLATCLMIAAISVSMTYVSVWYLNSKPYQAEVIDDGKEVRLLSISGRILWSRRTDEGGFGGAYVVNRPEDFGGGKLLVVGVPARDDVLAGGLHVFDLEVDWSWDQPLWSGLVTEESFPAKPATRELVAEQFHAQHVWMRDIFEESPGPEIVVSYAHGPYSQSCVRVYGLDGAVLFGFWHDGSVVDCHYDRESKRLLFTAINDECFWVDRGYKEVLDTKPWAVFAMKPTVGQRLGWVRSVGKGGNAIWYNFFMPPSAMASVDSLYFTSMQRGEGENGIVRLIAALRNREGPTVSLLIDADGVEVTGSRIITDQYKLDEALPEPTEFYLGSAPPCAELEAR